MMLTCWALRTELWWDARRARASWRSPGVAEPNAWKLSLRRSPLSSVISGRNLRLGRMRHAEGACCHSGRWRYGCAHRRQARLKRLRGDGDREGWHRQRLIAEVGGFHPSTVWHQGDRHRHALRRVVLRALPRIDVHAWRA